MHFRIIRYLQISLIAIDIVMINVVFFSVYFYFRDRMPPGASTASFFMGTYFSIAWLVVSFMTNIYKGKYIFSFKDFFQRSMNGLFYFLGFVIFSFFLFRLIEISRAFITVIMLAMPIGLLINRTFYLSVYRFLKSKNVFLDKVVVIGYNNLSKKLIHSLEESPINKEIVGICDEFENVNELHNYPILSNINDAFEVCKKYGVTEIYSSIAPEHNRGIYKLIQFADENCIHFHIIPDTSFFINRQCYISYVHGTPVISLRHEPLEEFSNRMKKEIFDVVISFLVVVFILSWMIPIVGLLIRLESKGPVLFKQTRSGKRGKMFSCLKFRSMKVNALAHEIQVTRNDQRLTRIGRFLRHTNLDEFPQFLNVLKGDMSIVGPRPHMLKHTMIYSKMMDEYMVRHFLKPGITGWAQVNGFRGEIDSFEKLKDRVDHDLWYLENWSIWLDLKIMMMTVFRTLQGDKNAV